MAAMAAILKIYFLLLLLKPKSQLTPNMVGSIGVTYRSKIPKIIPIGNPRWPPWQPSWKYIFCFFSWTERPIDSKLARTCLSNHHESCSKCLSWWFLGQVRNWVTWGQKLGHLAKSAENLVITLVVTFFKQSSWISLKMLVLMIFRSSLKLGHLGSKTRSPSQIS